MADSMGLGMQVGQNSFGDNVPSSIAYPRTLVINGEPFWQGSATGLTMSRLFKGWPKESLACLHLSNIPTDRVICERYWQLTVRDLRLVSRFLGKHYLRAPDSRKGLGEKAVLLPGANSLGGWARRMAILLRKRLAGQSVRELDVFQIPEDILGEIETFAPQVIYSTLASNGLMQLVIEMADYLKVPVVPHFMDDWLSILYRTSVFRPVLRRKMFERLAEIFDRSSKRLVIGEDMAGEYSSRYGGEFIPFMNAVEPEMLAEQVHPPPLRQILRLVYVGGLHLNRWRSLREIGLALNSLRDEGIQAEALIYTQHQFTEIGRKLEMPPAMHFAGSLEPAQVLSVLREADILLYVESFDRLSRKYAKYSISTKIPEYMAAARPILAYGPEELASIRYVSDSGAGLSVGRRDLGELLAKLRSLLVSESLRRALGSQGLYLALSRHNAKLQRDQFLSELNLVVAKA